MTARLKAFLREDVTAPRWLFVEACVAVAVVVVLELHTLVGWLQP